LQQKVSTLVSQGIVDLLEMIQVHNQQSQRLTIVDSRGDALFKALVEQVPVRQIGQQVVLGKVH